LDVITFSRIQATILGSLDSPYIVQYLESGTSKRSDVFWFVMELLVGDALDEWLQARGTMPELDAIKVDRDTIQVSIDLNLLC
jgi:serine/threonine protein kinase